MDGINTGQRNMGGVGQAIHDNANYNINIT